MHSNCWTTSPSRIDLLIKSGININAKDNKKRNALFILPRYIWHLGNHKQIIHQLVNSGINLHAKDKMGNNVLLFLIKKHYGNDYHKKYININDDKDELLKIFKLLLKKGVYINAQDNNGITPLMFASQIGSKKLVKFLVTNRAEVNIKTKHGSTALLLAYLEGNYQIMKLLTKAGASYADMYYSLGTYNLKIKRYNKAIRYFNKELEHKKTARLYNNLGVAYFKTSLLDKAESNF